MNDDDLDDDYGRELPRGMGCLIAFAAAAVMWGAIAFIIKETFFK
jgi:hypothetical protein